MSSRGLSWMGVAVGDPLYRPYLNWTQIDSKASPKSAAGWRAYHDFAIKNSDLEPSDYRTQAQITGGSNRHYPLLADGGLNEMRGRQFSTAIAVLGQARGDPS